MSAALRPVKRSPSPSTHATTTTIDDGQRGGVVVFGGSAPAIGGPRAFHGHTMMNSTQFYNAPAGSTSVIGNSLGNSEGIGMMSTTGGMGTAAHAVPPVAPLRSMSSHQIANLSVVSNASNNTSVIAALSGGGGGNQLQQRHHQYIYASSFGNQHHNHDGRAANSEVFRPPSSVPEGIPTPPHGVSRSASVQTSPIKMSPADETAGATEQHAVSALNDAPLAASDVGMGMGTQTEGLSNNTFPTHRDPAANDARTNGSDNNKISLPSPISAGGVAGNGSAVLLPKAAERQKLVNGEVVHSPADFFPFALGPQAGSGATVAVTGGANKGLASPRRAQLDQPMGSALPVNTAAASVVGLGAVPSLSPPRIHVVGNKSSVLRSMSSRGLSRSLAVGAGVGGGGVPSPRGQASPQSAKKAPPSPIKPYQASASSQATQPFSQPFPALVPSASSAEEEVGSLGELAVGREIAALREVHEQQRLLLIKQQEQYEELLRRHEAALRFTNGNAVNASGVAQGAVPPTFSPAKKKEQVIANNLTAVVTDSEHSSLPQGSALNTQSPSELSAAAADARRAVTIPPAAIDEVCPPLLNAAPSPSALLSSSESVNGVKLLYIPTMLEPHHQPTPVVGTIRYNGTSDIASNGVAEVTSTPYLVGEEALSAALRLATEKEESVRGGDGGAGGRAVTSVHGHTSSTGRTKGNDAADPSAVFLQQQEAALREAVGSDTPILVERCTRSGAKKLAVDVIVELKVLDANDERVFWTVRCRLSESVKTFKSKVIKVAKRFVAMLYLEGRKLDPPEASLWDCGVRADSILGCGCGSSLLARRLMASTSMTAPVHNKPTAAANSAISYSVRQQDGSTTPRAKNDGNSKAPVSGRTAAIDALGGGPRLSASSSHQDHQRRASSGSARGVAAVGAGHALRKRDASVVPLTSALRDQKANRGDIKGFVAVSGATARQPSGMSNPIRDFVEAVSAESVGQQQQTAVLTDEERRRLAGLGINVNIGSQNHRLLSATLADGDGGSKGVEKPHMQRVRYPVGFPQIPTTAIGGGHNDSAGHHAIGSSASSAAKGDLHVVKDNQISNQQQQQILLPDGAVSIPQPSADPLLARYEAYLARQDELKRKISVISSAAQINSGNPPDHTHIGGRETGGTPSFFSNNHVNASTSGNHTSVVPSSTLALHPRSDASTTARSQWLPNNNTNNTYGTHPHGSGGNHLPPPPLSTLGVGHSGRRAEALASENMSNPYHSHNHLHRDPNGLYRGEGDQRRASHVDRLVINDNETSTDEERMLAAALRPVPTIRTPQSDDAYFSAIYGVRGSSLPPSTTAPYAYPTNATDGTAHTTTGIGRGTISNNTTTTTGTHSAYRMNTSSFSSCTTSPTKPPADVVSTRPPSAASMGTALLQSPPRRPSTAEPPEGNGGQQQLLRGVEAHYRLPTHGSSNNGPPSQPHHFVPHAVTAATAVRNPLPQVSFAAPAAQFAQPLPPLSHGFSSFPPSSINAEKQLEKATAALDRVLLLEAQRVEEEAVMAENTAETAAREAQRVVGRDAAAPIMYNHHLGYRQPSSGSDGSIMLLPAQLQHYPPAAVGVSSSQHPTTSQQYPPPSPFPHSNTANEHQYQRQEQQMEPPSYRLYSQAQVVGPTSTSSSQRFAEKYQQQQQTVAAARQALAELDQERARLQMTKSELQKQQHKSVSAVRAKGGDDGHSSGAQWSSSSRPSSNGPLQQRRITFADEAELMTTLAVPSYDTAHIGAPSGLSPLGEGRV